jgi:hypothetical protein
MLAQQERWERRRAWIGLTIWRAKEECVTSLPDEINEDNADEVADIVRSQAPQLGGGGGVGAAADFAENHGVVESSVLPFFSSVAAGVQAGITEFSAERRALITACETYVDTYAGSDRKGLPRINSLLTLLQNPATTDAGLERAVKKDSGIYDWVGSGERKRMIKPAAENFLASLYKGHEADHGASL